ncbi:helix-turn-helix domain-containing protein [Bartonella sp. TT121SHDZB]|uniref:helix-turn-helix domain-containing protein n=1 Tax=Bartonella sp. TT121SHDZB TaxID=3243580 RepID=UPI0035CFEBC7
MGKKLGVSFQQIPKYEKGINRVEAGRLQEIVNIFDVYISFLSYYALKHRCLRGGMLGVENFRRGD